MSSCGCAWLLSIGPDLGSPNPSLSSDVVIAACGGSGHLWPRVLHGYYCICSIVKDIDLGSEADLDGEQVVVPQLNEKDGKTFEMIQKIIEGRQIEKLKVEQCKLYLRKNGLRLTGNKDTLIQRIKEHLEILNGGGEEKYRASSFILNCKGDACTGVVVMFEQNVYEICK